MNLVEFYKVVLSNLKLTTTEDNFIKLTDAKSTTWTTGGKAIVLPTKEHVATLLSEDDDGKPVVNKVLFNPLDENVIKGNSVSINKMKELIEYRTSHSIAAAGGLLLRLAMNSKLTSPMYIQSFLTSIKEADSPNTKKIIDDRTIELWDKFYTNSVKHKTPFVKVFVKKSGIIDGVKHNRTATMTFPSYNALCELEKGDDIFNITLRKKDITIFKLIFKYLLREDTLSKVETYSNSGESPAFISLMSLHINVNKFVNKTIKALKHIDQELFDTGHVDITLTTEDINVDSIYTKELNALPSDIEVGRSLTNVMNASNITDVNLVQKNTDLPIANYQAAVAQPTPTAPENTLSTPADSNLSAIDKILYGSGNNIQQPAMVPQQQMLMPQQQLQQYNQQAIPGGINTLLATGASGIQQQMVMPQQQYQPQPYQQQSAPVWGSPTSTPYGY